MKRAITVGCVLTLATSALAEELVLQGQDSITIDGTRYTCADPSRRGVQLAPGDRLKAGRWRLRCVSDDAGGVPDEPRPETRVTSVVDPACIQALDVVISGHPSAGDAVRWADACRTVDVPRACTIASQQPDPGCFAKLDTVISGHFSPTDAPNVQRACQRVEASCPARRTSVTSTVDLACLDQLNVQTSGRPSPSAVIGWIGSCRGKQGGRCVPVGGKFNNECVSKANIFISGRFSASEAPAVALACRTIELTCD